MKVLIVLSAIVASVFAADLHGNAAVAQFEHVVRQEVAKLFASADTNGDGNFDKADMVSLFTTYDANHDKSVTEAEFVSRFAGQEKDLSIIAKGLFLELDMDRSGAVTDSDLDLYFRKIDQNDDGKVQKSEFEKYFTEVFTILFILQAQQQQQTTVAPGGK